MTFAIRTYFGPRVNKHYGLDGGLDWTIFTTGFPMKFSFEKRFPFVVLDNC